MLSIETILSAYTHTHTHLHTQAFYFAAIALQGAPEGLLDRCTHVRIGHNKVPMSPAIKNEIMKLTKIYGTGTHPTVELLLSDPSQIKTKVVLIK